MTYGCHVCVLVAESRAWKSSPASLWNSKSVGQISVTDDHSLQQFTQRAFSHHADAVIGTDYYRIDMHTIIQPLLQCMHLFPLQCQGG